MLLMRFARWDLLRVAVAAAVAVIMVIVVVVVVHSCYASLAIEAATIAGTAATRGGGGAAAALDGVHPLTLRIHRQAVILHRLHTTTATTEKKRLQLMQGPSIFY
jgi:hypothetical protein